MYDEAAEAQVVEFRREAEAREAGLNEEEAAIFAVNGEDVGLLRKLVSEGVEPSLIAAIVL